MAVLHNVFTISALYTYAWKDDAAGKVAQSVTCLTADTRLNADPGLACSIPAWSHTFVEIIHELISTFILRFLSEGLLSVTSESIARSVG